MLRLPFYFISQVSVSKEGNCYHGYNAKQAESRLSEVEITGSLGCSEHALLESVIIRWDTRVSLECASCFGKADFTKFMKRVFEYRWQI
jgi:hypothetical protein